MKQQSKPKKSKKENNQMPGDWLYFAPENVTVRHIFDVLTNANDDTITASYEVEIWEDAGVLEVGLSDGATLDIEQTEIPAKDGITTAFAKEHGCECVFLVTIKPEEFDIAKNAMQKIVASLGGLFCGDTEDFTPVLQ